MRQICFSFDNTITLYQTGFDLFTVQYGRQIENDLSYAQAARALGRAIMHSVACDGRLDSRTMEEAMTGNGDVEPYYTNAVPA